MSQASIQAIINDIYRLPRTGYPDLIAELHGGRIQAVRLMLIFRSGMRYCCMEPVCFLGFYNHYDRIIAAARQAGIVMSDRIPIKVLGMVQAGAMFAEPYPHTQATPYEYVGALRGFSSPSRKF